MIIGHWMASASAAIVVGGAGALGKALVARLLAQGLTTTCVDIFKNPEASRSVELDVQGNWAEVGARATEELKALHGAAGGVTAVFHVAGGWVGGGVTDLNFLNSVDKMWKLNVQSAALAASIAGNLLQPDGLVVMTGASAALGSTPSMLGYGMSKASTHFLVQSLAADPLLRKATVAAILPVTIDTPANRMAMPDAKHEDWTKPEEIADNLVSWTTTPRLRPRSGALIKVTTTAGKSTWLPVW